MQYFITHILLLSYCINAHAYLFFKLPSRVFHEREISSWKCAQKCLNKLEDFDYSGIEYRQKHNTENESSGLEIYFNLLNYCQRSEEELSCLKECPKSDVQMQILDIGTKIQTLACSNLSASVKMYTCVLESVMLAKCVFQTCESEFISLNLAIDQSVYQGNYLIPGKQFCSLEECSHGCMKKILPLTCGEQSFSLYTNIKDMANIVQSLSMFEEKPSTENGILCIDRPFRKKILEDENDEEFDF